LLKNRPFKHSSQGGNTCPRRGARVGSFIEFFMVRNPTIEEVAKDLNKIEVPIAFVKLKVE